MLRLAALIAMLGLAGCTAAIADPVDGSVLAKCYFGASISFCAVHKAKEDAVVSNNGIVTAATSAITGASVGSAIK